MVGVGALTLAGCAAARPTTDFRAHVASIGSLTELSIPALRGRTYGALIELQRKLGSASGHSPDRHPDSRDGSARQDSYLGSYRSDGLRVYTRIDVPPAPPPAAGYPVVLLAHGWVGIDRAPDFDFGSRPNSFTGATIQAFVQAGFVVLTPGFRGHGTVDGIPAEGIEFLAAWDNGSYVSPIFYAIDLLNLLDGLPTLSSAAWAETGRRGPEIQIDLDRVYLTGHSQGGDVALTVLAAAGEGSRVNQPVAAASIWAGTFAPRIEQGNVYHAMQSTPEAFLSGDGSWTGSAVGAGGSVNPDFVFAFPPDWIGSVDPAQWSWQRETWDTPSVAQALDAKFTEMYDAINARVGDIDAAQFELFTDGSGRSVIRHDPRVVAALDGLGGYAYPEFLTEPLSLHHSDRDFYSLPRWNADLCVRINKRGGDCADFTYPGNTHSFEVSPRPWFSPPSTTAAFPHVVKRDLALFSGHDPRAIGFP